MTTTLNVPEALPLHYAQVVRYQWERFVSGALAEAEQIRPIVRESWIRRREAGLDPARLPAALPGAEDTFAAMRDGDLLSPRSPAVVENLLSTASLPLQSLVVLANPQSQIVHVTGDRRAYRPGRRPLRYGN